MLIRILQTSLAVASLLTCLAFPLHAEDYDEGEHDRSEHSVSYLGEFDLSVFEDGMVEAAIDVGPTLEISSMTIHSEDLEFGPLQEITPGLWIAEAFGPDGSGCYRATAELKYTGDSESDHDDSEDDGHDSHSRSKKKAHSEHDEDESKTVAMRIGASVCIVSNPCETSSDVPATPGDPLSSPPTSPNSPGTPPAFLPPSLGPYF